MAQRLASNTYGKAFLWLVAIAIALLIEGFLSEQYGDQAPAEASSVEHVMETPGSKAALKIEKLAGAVIEVAKLFGTIR